MTQSPPAANAEAHEKMVFLQEQMVNFVNQYNVPLVEVSLVIAKYLNQLVTQLQEIATETGEVLPDIIMEQIQLTEAPIESGDFEYSLENVVNMVDVERMDILDTIIRVVLNQTEMQLADAVLQLRQWELLTRTQLAKVKSPGQLFSPFEIPPDF